MNYPVPVQQELFLFDHKLSEQELEEAREVNSGTEIEKNDFMDEYKAFLTKHRDLLASIPFVEQIYLCNSMTFNALTEQSDIDLTIVSQESRIRTAKFFTTLYLFIRGLRRHKQMIRKKFCTCFYLTPSALNLYPTKLKEHTDIYLIYWLAHLIPLYSRERKKRNTLGQNNQWIKNFLPNYPGGEIQTFDIRCESDTSKSKKRVERLLSGVGGSIFEKLIKYTRLPVILLKKRKLKNSSGIIIHDKMLKFFNDKRAKIQFLFDLKKSQ